MKCLTTLLGVVGIVSTFAFPINAQTFTVKPGKWSSPSVWSDGIVPDNSSGEIIINHRITIPQDTSFAVDDVTVNDTLILSKSAVLILQNARGALADLRIASGGLKVWGKLICRDSATFSGTSAANTIFYDSASYEHQYFNTAGAPPPARWQQRSTLEITGYITGKSLNSPDWDQFFGNVTYNCMQQQNGSFVELLGNIRRVSGNFIVKTTNSGVLRLTLDKTTLTTISIGGDLIIEGNSEVWFSRNATTAVTVAGDFQFRSTSTASSYLTTTGTCQLTVAGNMIVHTSAPFRFASSGGGTGTLNVKKNFSFEAGTITLLPVGHGTLILNGNTPQLFSSLGNLTTGIDVEINNPEGVTIGTNSNVGGNVLVRASSSLQLPAGNFILQGNLDIESGGSIEANNGTLNLTGPLNQTISLQGDTLYAIRINKLSAATVSFNSSAHLKNELWVETPGNTVFSNGNLTLLSASDDGSKDAFVRTLPAGSSIAGAVTVQRFMQGEGRIYRYISSPVTGATVADLQDDFAVTGTFDDSSTGPGIGSDGPSLYYYTENLPGVSGWINYPSSGMAAQHPLIPGKGYSAFIRQSILPTVWDVTGTLNQQEVNFNVTYTNTGDLLDGWNLIGNPYASPIDWDVETGWTKVNVEDEIAVRDNGTGSFLYWDGSVGSLQGGYIAKGQSFWIQTNNNNPSLIIKEQAKSVSNAPFFRMDPADADYVEFSIDQGTLSDKAYLRLRNNAVAGYDRFDVVKWNNDHLNLALIADTIPLAIVATNRLDCSVAFPLQLYFTKKADGSLTWPTAGTYTLSANSFCVFQYAAIILTDHFTEQTFDLSSGKYSFIISSDPASFRKNRFTIQVSSDTLNTAVAVTADSIVCADSPLTISLDTLQREVRYEAWLNGVEAASYLNERHDHVEFTIEPDKARNYIQVIAKTACNATIVKDLLVRKIEQLEDPVITEANDTLRSSYENGNQWYLNGEKLTGEIFPFIRPEAPGEYKTEVFLYGCTISASYNYIFQDDHFQVFPNPCNDLITFVAPRAALVDEVNIFHSNGQLIKRSVFDLSVKQGVIFVQDLPAGLYVAEIVTKRRRRMARFLKE
jgi:hypothetical protein